MYDYVKKGDLIGEAKDKKIYLLFEVICSMITVLSYPSLLPIKMTIPLSRAGTK